MALLDCINRDQVATLTLGHFHSVFGVKFDPLQLAAENGSEGGIGPYFCCLLHSLAFCKELQG